MTDHGCTLIHFVLVGGATLRKGSRERNVDERMSMNGFALSERVPLEDPIAQTRWTDARESALECQAESCSFF